MTEEFRGTMVCVCKPAGVKAADEKHDAVKDALGVIAERYLVDAIITSLWWDFTVEVDWIGTDMWHGVRVAKKEFINEGDPDYDPDSGTADDRTVWTYRVEADHVTDALVDCWHWVATKEWGGLEPPKGEDDGKGD